MRILESKIHLNQHPNHLELRVQVAFQKAFYVIPYRTGWLAYNTDYELNGDTITLFVDDVEYAKYLEYDIPKTRGWWEKFTKVFSLSLNGNYAKADAIVNSIEDDYGYEFNLTRLANFYNVLKKLDKQLYKKLITRSQ